MGLFDRKKKQGRDAEAGAESVAEEIAEEAAPEEEAHAGSNGLAPARIDVAEDGWGEGFTVVPTHERGIVLSVTPGGIHPVAQRLGSVTGAEVVEGYGQDPVMDMVAAVVIDTDSSARISAYAMNGTPTLNIAAAAPSGPLADYISADNYVAGIGVDQVNPTE